MRLDSIPAEMIRFILPRHEITDAAKRDQLAADMRTNGWQGRPLLLRIYCDTLQALTGTHRLAAANAAEIELPALIIEDSDLSEEQWDELERCSDDEDMQDLFSEADLIQAANLMIQEIEANNE